MLLAALLSACGADSGPTTQTAAPAAAPSAQTEASTDSAEPPVRQRAEDALRAQRLFAPAGDNAFELFLQVLADTPDDAFARDALQDLVPYAVLQVDQRLAAGDRAEATRLLELLQRAQPDAPALPRLQRSLDALSSAPPASSVVTASSAAAVAAPAQPEAPAVTTQIAPTVAAVPEPLQPPPASPAPAATEPPETESVSPPETAPTAPAETAAAPSSSPTSTAVPRLLRQTAPRYPAVAGRRKLEGLVELAFTIAPNGRVVDIQVLRSEPPGLFDRAAVDAIEDWRYEAPAQNVRTSRTFEFKLD